MILGIDPGNTGAIAVMDEGKILALHDMPCTAKRTGKGLEVNAYLLVTALRTLGITPEGAYIEQVSAMPGQGVSSMFTFGRSLGVVEGVLAALQIPVQFVPPGRWKKHHGLIGKDKDASRTLVLSKYPDRTEDFLRKKDVGRADAVLIAEYGITLM